MKFMRRSDLTLDVRINIALEALTNLGTYGLITGLAETYNVSRTFIYTLIYGTLVALYVQLNSVLYPGCPVTVRKTVADKEILIQRLEGNSSIESISHIMSYHNIYPSSVGYISQCLASYGNRLPNTIEISASEKVNIVVWLNDEIFASNQPILLTVEPKSLAILRIQLAEKRDAQTWEKHFSQLQQHGFYPAILGSDRGKGIVKACQDKFPDVDFRPDTFHDVRGLYRAIHGTLQKRAYDAITQEYKSETALACAISINVQAKRLLSYSEAKEQAKKAIDIYDNASYLLSEIREQLLFIDEQGRFRNPQSAQLNILTAIDLLTSLGDIKVLEEAYMFKSNLDELLGYMNTAQETYHELSAKITNQELLQTLCLAWRFEHKLYQNPALAQKRYLTEMKDFALQYCQLLAGQNYSDYKEQVFCCLDNIIRASSLVETVNSIISPYLDTCKGQIAQGMLNLIMFYHNHRKFTHGKRKGKAPLERLTGQELKEHWVDILVDKAGSVS